MNSQFKELSDGLLIMADGVGLCQEFKDKWHWSSLSLNPSLTLALIKTFESHWDWNAIFKNDKIK